MDYFKAVIHNANTSNTGTAKGIADPTGPSFIGSASSGPWLILFPFFAASALFVCQMFYNCYLHPLSKFPGPKLAGATRWYETYLDLCTGEGGQYMYHIQKMHKKYGPIVRVAPNELHINDLYYREILYAMTSKGDKVPYMVDMLGTPLSIFGTASHHVHKMRRAPLSPFFSQRSVIRLESVIESKTGKLMDGISKSFCDGRDLTLRHVLTALAADVTSQYSFGKCFDALDDKNFSPQWHKMLAGVTEGAPIARAFPGFVQLTQALPVGLVRQFNPLMAGYSEYIELIRDLCRQIHEQYTKGELKRVEKTDDGIPTIFHEILFSKLPDSEKSVERLTQESLSFVSAAAETTIAVLSSVIFHVFRDKELLRSIRQELDSIPHLDKAVSTWKELEKLPLLTATIKEGLRCSVPVTGRLPLSLQDSSRYKDWDIPAGTYVGMSLGDALHHPGIFPSPKSFLPNRWLDASTEQSREMEMAFVPFGRGPRACIGKNLAWANLYHICAALFRRFDIDIIDTDEARDVQFSRDYFVSKPSRTSHGVRMRVLKEYK